MNRILNTTMAVLAACAVISCSKEQGKDNADTGIPVVIPTPTPGQTAKTVLYCAGVRQRP